MSMISKMSLADPIFKSLKDRLLFEAYKLEKEPAEYVNNDEKREYFINFLRFKTIITFLKSLKIKNIIAYYNIL